MVASKIIVLASWMTQREVELTQTADYYLHHANENVTTIVPLFRGTQREYSSKPLQHSIVKHILVFKR